MKNRKTVVVAFLLVAAMLLGVGYAALSDTLTIVGTAQIDMNAAGNEFDEKVYFNAAKVVSSTGSGDKAKDTASHTTDDATYEVHSLAVLSEEAVFAFEIKSTSNVAVNVTANATKLSGVANPSNSNEEYFDVKYEYYDDYDDATKTFGTKLTEGNVQIASNGSIWVKVIVSVKKAVVTATGATFGIELTATTVDP